MLDKARFLKMDVLIIYQYRNHKSLVKSIVDEMRQRGIVISAVNSVYFDWYGVEHPLMYIVSIAQFCTKRRLVRVFFLRYFKLRFLGLFSKNYKLIDFESYNSVYGSLINSLVRDRQEYMITFWGSDILRKSQEQIEKEKSTFNRAKQIRAVSLEIYEKCQNLLDDPTRLTYCPFGVVGVDRVVEFVDNSEVPENNLPTAVQSNLKDSTILIVLGNNGSRAQNHFQGIEAIREVVNRFRDKDMVLLLPVTYSLDPTYKLELINALEKLSLKTILLSKYLSDAEFTAITLRTDVYLTLQESDAYSLYLQEQLASGSIVIHGNWLKYRDLLNEGVFLTSTNMEELGKTLLHMLENYHDYKKKSTQNIKLIGTSSGWENRGDVWHKSFLFALNPNDSEVWK